jgi:hypothetical protein
VALISRNDLTTRRAYYAATIADFQSTSDAAVLGELTAGSPFAIDPTQRDAWQAEILILRPALAGLEGAVLLEYDVPRVGSRIDAVVLAGAAVMVVEFKVGEARFLEADRNQAWDYGLDLKNFHKASHHRPIVPILVATEAEPNALTWPTPAPDGVYPPMLCSREQLGVVIRHFAASLGDFVIDPRDWISAPYHPTPTIIEAAQALYARHSVESIASSEAGANLSVTSGIVEQVIDTAQSARQKAIVFVTGVPGAGKTLVGLNIATRHRDEHEPTHAVYLSGNGPLVKVLSHALANDEVSRQATIARRDTTFKKSRKGEILQKIKAFIQNVHHFRDEGLNHDGPPIDHVVIFDEAQRAWNREMTADFMKRKKGRPGFTLSEPEFLLSYLDRHDDWCVVVCLVGGGQEINRGEAGIKEWLDAVSQRCPTWTVHVSPTLADSEYDAAATIASLRATMKVEEHQSLHLATSMRSFRAEHVSRFVKAVLDRDVVVATEALASVRSRYPIVLTRDLDKAKNWVRRHARGSERYGLVASSGAERLKPHAVDVRVEVDPVHWFLNSRDDTRSSYYLEDAATEFQVQGLELDWTCVTWDADLRAVGADWSYHSFRANGWQNVRKPDRRSFLRNSYRVLLTRARQGMVIFVPPGSDTDPTRNPDFYNPTFEYLESLGISVI